MKSSFRYGGLMIGALPAVMLTVLAPQLPAQACCLEAGAMVATDYRVAGLDDRRFTPEAYWAALEPALATGAVTITEVGSSLEGRPLRAITFGTGATTVLLWSQMHGDEATASMALADLSNYLAHGSDSLWHSLAGALTVVMIPVLNPDGALRFRRHNALGIDINRDARRLATPEGRTLKRVRDSLSPAFGFNLHDQGTRTAGFEGELVGIALLAPAADEERSWGTVRRRARQVAAGIVEVLEHEIPRQLAKYDDTFEPRAFGDNMQAWGTSTVLIESGALRDDPQKQRLRAINVIALLSSLHAIASGDYRMADPLLYESLPYNRGLANDILLLGGSVVLAGKPPVRADVALVYDDRVALTTPLWGEVGDLQGARALDTVDVTGLYLHPRTMEGPAGVISRGAPAFLEVRRGSEPDSELVTTIPEAR